MTAHLGLAFLAACGFAAWALTRGLRRSWYPRFGIEIVLATLLLGMAAVGYAGAAYEHEHPNQGEPEY